MPLVERRYAEALIGISRQAGEIEAYQHDLETVVELYNNQPDFRQFLLNPEFKAEAKKSAIDRILNGKVKQELISFISLLLDKGRIKNLPGILTEYIKLSDKLRNILAITIISSAPLSESETGRILTKYKNIHKASDVKVNLEIDPGLIGGVMIKIGDKVIDGSISGRLEGLRELLVKA